MTWMRQTEPISVPGDEKLRRVADTSVGCAASQRDLKRMKKWAHRNLLKLNQGKCQVVPQGRSNPRYHYRLEPTNWKATCQKRTWQADHKPATHS